MVLITTTIVEDIIKMEAYEIRYSDEIRFFEQEKFWNNEVQDDGYEILEKVKCIYHNEKHDLEHFEIIDERVVGSRYTGVCVYFGSDSDIDTALDQKSIDQFRKKVFVDGFEFEADILKAKKDSKYYDWLRRNAFYHYNPSRLFPDSIFSIRPIIVKKKKYKGYRIIE